MSFLAPLALLFGLLAGAIIVMYLFKLRRTRAEVSSTLLWLRSMEDLIANAPFQKLRQNLLMYLQIFALLLLALALARPTMWLNRRVGASQIILVDNSASMNAADADEVGRPRLDAARDAAHQLVDNMSRGDQAMVVTFGGEASVLTPFTTEKATLRGAIDRIEPTDAGSAIREALLLAQGVRKVEKQATLMIISDGGLGHLGNLVAEDDPIQYVQIGGGRDNRGFVAFDVRESFERRGEIQAFAEVENFSDQPAEVLVRCLIDGEVMQVKEETIAAEGKAGFAFAGLGGGMNRLLRLELAGEDALAADNVVQGHISLDPTIAILVVSQGNFFLERLLALLPQAEVSRIAPADYQPSNGYDLTVFDQFSPEALAPGNYLFINAVPPLPGFEAAEEPLTNQVILDWNRLHPVTRFVKLETLAVNEALDLTYPDWVSMLAESAEAPMVLAGEHQGVRLICIPFDLYVTDWPLQVSFPIFMVNAAQWMLGAGTGGLDAVHHTTGQTVMIPAQGTVAIEGPAGERWRLEPGDDGIIYFNQTLRVGQYHVELGEDEERHLAVNLLERAESDIMPREALFTGEKKVTAMTLSRENREIWPWFALFGLAILTVEWHLYCRRSWL